MNAPPPKIAINGRFLTQIVSGVQRFAIETVKAIDSLLDTAPYAALKGRIEIVAPPDARAFDLANIPLRRTRYLDGYAWEQIEFPMAATGQVLLNLCMLGPVAVRNQVVVIHDATTRAWPQNFSARFRAAYRLLIPLLCRRADLIVTVSEFSRREIGKWYGADTGKIPICYEVATTSPPWRPIPRRSIALPLATRNFFSALVSAARTRISRRCWPLFWMPSSMIRCWFLPVSATPPCMAGSSMCIRKACAMSAMFRFGVANAL